MKIEEITIEKVSDIINSKLNGSKKFEPLGLFFAKVHEHKYIAIDNRIGDAWTEEFDTREECIKWLKGEEF